MALIRSILSRIKRLLVLLIMLPFWGLTRVTRYVYVSQLISLIPLRFGEQVRYEFYRHTLARCGEDVTITFGTIISYPDITLGNHVWLGDHCNVGHADIEDYVMAARNCHFVSGRHAHPFDRTDIPIMQQQGEFGRVRIGPDVWLGSGVIVMENIGQGCVIGAGSVVTRSIPPFSIATGAPARVVARRGEVCEDPGDETDGQ